MRWLLQFCAIVMLVGFSHLVAAKDAHSQNCRSLLITEFGEVSQDKELARTLFTMAKGLAETFEEEEEEQAIEIFQNCFALVIGNQTAKILLKLDRVGC